jgi:hypothetical protein
MTEKDQPTNVQELEKIMKLNWFNPEDKTDHVDVMIMLRDLGEFEPEEDIRTIYDRFQSGVIYQR